MASICLFVLKEVVEDHNLEFPNGPKTGHKINTPA
jgi:hypothetical protein